MTANPEPIISARFAACAISRIALKSVWLRRSFTPKAYQAIRPGQAQRQRGASAVNVSGSSRRDDSAAYCDPFGIDDSLLPPTGGALRDHRLIAENPFGIGHPKLDVL